MPRALSICLEPGCTSLTDGSRCPEHERTSSRNHFGVPRHDRGHGADYERRRAELVGQPCHWCGKRADTADYAVPVSQGGTLADLVPACAHCNYARGAELTNARPEMTRGTAPAERRRWFA